MYPRVLLNSDGLAHVLRELLEICKDNWKGRTNDSMSPSNFMVRFWAAYCFRLYLSFTANSAVGQHRGLPNS